MICSLCVSVAAYTGWDSRRDLQPVCQCGKASHCPATVTKDLPGTLWQGVTLSSNSDEGPPGDPVARRHIVQQQ